VLYLNYKNGEVLGFSETSRTGGIIVGMYFGDKKNLSELVQLTKIGRPYLLNALL